MRPLDRIDYEILGLLQKNARISNKELAAHVGVAPSTCLERVRRLIEEKVLLGFHARIAPKAVGIGIEAMIAVRLAKHDHGLVERFADHALALPAVRAVYHMAGANDYLIHMLARDAEHLRELGMTSFTTRPELEHMETALIFQHRESQVLPVYLEAEDD
ncbi:MAG: Lrp/AsnC family transcriptional regulator [Holophagales bacterium]|nr:Lrp/AsnC family transcriptional regulator [Holophagales bacterium]